jgi:hypothetical protein
MQTTSETAFENFLRENNLKFEKIPEQATARPDYKVQAGEVELVFEVKEIRWDKDFEIVNGTGSSVRVVGEHVRKTIGRPRTRKQIKFGAEELGLPSILLLYNNVDPLHSLEPRIWILFMACTMIWSESWVEGRSRRDHCPQSGCTLVLWADCALAVSQWAN